MTAACVRERCGDDLAVLFRHSGHVTGVRVWQASANECLS
jgi:uncharacterized protein YuzE